VLQEIYAQKYSTFEALRTAMVQSGIVDHGLNPYDVIQRAIDDTTTDYLLIRKTIDRDTNGNPYKLINHELYPAMEKARETMVRYSTYAAQYDIQSKQLRLSENRIALLASALRQVLTSPQINLTPAQVRQVPKLLIEHIGEHNPGQDDYKATALAEILHEDSEVIIEDAETGEQIIPPEPDENPGYVPSQESRERQLKKQKDRDTRVIAHEPQEKIKSRTAPRRKPNLLSAYTTQDDPNQPAAKLAPKPTKAQIRQRQRALADAAFPADRSDEYDE